MCRRYTHIIAVFMVIAMAFLSVSEVTLWGVYATNKSRIATELCVNTADASCQGSCFVRQTTQNTPSTSSHSASLRTSVEFSPGVLSSRIDIQETASQTLPHSSFTRTEHPLLGYPQTVFQPPVV